MVVDLAQAAEVSHRLVVDGSHLANRPLSDMELPVVVGGVVAIQRGRRWLTDVGGDDIVEAGDALFMRGTGWDFGFENLPLLRRGYRLLLKPQAC